MKSLQHPELIAQYAQLIRDKYAVVTSDLQWRSLERGECLYEQGYPLDYLAFLLKGKVRIYTSSAEGKQLIVAFNTPLELYGEIELIQQVDTLHTIEAVTPIHVAIVPLTIAQSWRKDANFNELLLQSISRKFLTKSSTLAFHLLHEADVKLASYLLAISHDEHGQFVNDVIAKSELKMIAQFIGITVRHQNRCLQLFEQLDLIERIPGFIKITNPTALLQYAKQNIYEMQ